MALLVKLEELDAYAHVVLRGFPKFERHLLSADIRACSSRLLRLVVTAWKRYHKKTALTEIDVELEVMRHLVRKSLRLKYINPNRYRVWSGHLAEIGKMVGGWIRSEQARTGEKGSRSN